MHDRATDSEWSQILGRAIDGEMHGASLEEIPLAWAPWKLWKERGIDAPVLSTDTGHLHSYGTDPYGSYFALDKGYYEDPSTFFDVLTESDRLEAKEVVVGVKTGDRRHAILKGTALKKGVRNLELSGRSVVAVADPALNLVRVFHRSMDGKTLQFRSGDNDGLLNRRSRSRRAGKPSRSLARTAPRSPPPASTRLSGSSGTPSTPRRG